MVPEIYAAYRLAQIMILKKFLSPRKCYELVMTLLVRDEEDIISHNIEFHLSQGVDFFIVTDNLSTDRTPQILKKYERQGILKYIFNNDDTLNQAKWVTAMARDASKEYGARWVINNDADEFWWPSHHPSLREFFHALPRKYNIVEAERVNFVPVTDSREKFFRRMIYKEDVAKNPLGKKELPKVCHRGNPNVTVAGGNHKVAGFRRYGVHKGGIEVLHFPLRTYEQFERKTTHHGQGLENNKQVHPKVNIANRTLYKEFFLKGKLQLKYEEQSYDEKKIATSIEEGKLIRDFRLRDCLDNLRETEALYPAKRKNGQV